MKVVLLVVGLVGLLLLLEGPVFWWDGPVGLAGGVFGAIFGLIGGVFGAAVGVAAGLFGAAVGLAAGLFGAVVGLGVMLAVFGLPLLVVVLVVYGLVKAVVA